MEDINSTGERSAGSTGLDDDFIDDRAIASAAEDKLGHAPLAQEVALLARTVHAPVSIGLFGPWGSGKSSLLRLIAEALSSENVPVVYLDAWKYAETPLARQFISTTAEQLSGGTTRKARRARRKARSRLYEARRTRNITLRGWKFAVFGLLAFLATLALGIGFAAAITTVVADRPWAKALESVLPSILGGTTIVALVTFALTSFTAESETERAGSEEEFEDAFRDVVQSHVNDQGRVAFLVDEVDRTRPSEVLATLETLRIFLDVEGCIFIVAGDRQIIEDALIAAPLHGAPRWPRAAYYGMAGSFLDKMFQIQLDLPPLNEERLTEFVYRLLGNQQGVWAQPEIDLEELVPILIPSHVRSPRRAKVLINAFALALRLARTRFKLNSDEAVDPAGQELALAKLVVLRTEFPLFAEELPEHPTLTEALTAHLVAREEEGETEANAVLEKFPEPTTALAREFSGGKRDVEQVLPLASHDLDDGDPSSGRHEDLSEVRTQELARYLTSTADTPHPDRNLIFGTVLGRLYDLNAEIAAALEAGALDGRRREVEGVLAELDPEQRVAGVKLLCDLATKIGAQGRRSMEALVIALDFARDDDLAPASSLLARAISAFTRKNTIPDDWAPLLLRVSRWLPAEERTSLQLDLLARDSWQATEETIQETISSAPYWTDDTISAATARIPVLLETSPQATISVLMQLAPQLMNRLWSTDCWTALADAEADKNSIASVAERLGDADRKEAWGAVTDLAPEHPDKAIQVARGLGGAQTQAECLDLVRVVAEEHASPAEWSSIAELLNG